MSRLQHVCDIFLETILAGVLIIGNSIVKGQKGAVQIYCRLLIASRGVLEICGRGLEVEECGTQRSQEASGSGLIERYREQTCICQCSWYRHGTSIDGLSYLSTRRGGVAKALHKYAVGE